jgi:hypothetical protein
MRDAEMRPREDSLRRPLQGNGSCPEWRGQMGAMNLKREVEMAAKERKDHIEKMKEEFFGQILTADFTDGEPESLAMRLWTHSKGERIADQRFRRRDADGCGRDDRAPREVANDWGTETVGHECQRDQGGYSRALLYFHVAASGTGPLRDCMKGRWREWKPPAHEPPIEKRTSSPRPSPPQVCGGEGEDTEGFAS